MGGIQKWWCMAKKQKNKMTCAHFELGGELGETENDALHFAAAQTNLSRRHTWWKNASTWWRSNWTGRLAVGLTVGCRLFSVSFFQGFATLVPRHLSIRDVFALKHCSDMV